MSQEGPFDTVTHARLRAFQGDVRGAERLLRGILDRNPSDADAKELLAALERYPAVRPIPEDDGTLVEPRRPAAANELASAFRAALGGRAGRGPGRTSKARLREWAARIERNRGVRRVH